MNTQQTRDSWQRVGPDVQHESFMLHDVKLFWHPSVLESFLLLNTQFFTVYVVPRSSVGVVPFFIYLATLFTVHSDANAK
jgi:hypothetical protein